MDFIQCNCKKCLARRDSSKNPSVGADQGKRAAVDSYEGMAGRYSLRLPKKIGTKSFEVLLEFQVFFPDRYPAVDVHDVKSRVGDLEFELCKDKVFIRGVLHRSIIYSCREGTCRYRYAGAWSNAVYGMIKSVSVSLPFTGFLEIPGICPGDEIAVDFAGVEAGCEAGTLTDPVYIRGSRLPVYGSLKGKTLVTVNITALRQSYMDLLFQT